LATATDDPKPRSGPRCALQKGDDSPWVSQWLGAVVSLGFANSGVKVPFVLQVLAGFVPLLV